MLTEQSSEISASSSELKSSREKLSRTPVDTLKHNLISISAILLLISFFMPWVNFFGVVMNGLSIQHNFTSYKFIWVMPLFALVTFALNMINLPVGFVRRFAGLCAYGVFLYSVAKFGADILPEIKFGGWLALASGAALVFLPSESHNSKRSVI